MNKHYQSAAQRLHKFAAEGADFTETELRAELEAQGVNTEAFLGRLGQEAGIKRSLVTTKKPTASERLRALANRAGNKVKGFLGELNTGDATDMPVRNKRTRASSRDKRGGKTSS
jgi:hypothetical protein